MTPGGRGRSFAAMTTTVSRTSQILLALMGAVVLFGSVYFTTAGAPDDIDAVGYAVGAWAFAMSIGFLVGAVRPGPWVRGLVALHLVFGVVKLVGYHESAAVPFMAVDVLLLAMLSRGRRPS
jgi:hypothetical protein